MTILQERVNTVEKSEAPSLPSGMGEGKRVGRVDRVLPRLVEEGRMGRRLGVVVAVWVAAFFALVVFSFWAPADGGVDQNAYLVGGRMIAEHGTPRYDLPNPFAYSGAMFIRTASGAYYPKYPFGLPLLYAVVFWVFGAAKGATLAFMVSPVSAVLAVLGMFYLAREVAGTFAALLAAILLGSSQLMLALADNPNSHASCVAFVVWGMFLLVRWWQTGSMWRGALAGFLVGYACLIRYSEGLLILPIAVATLHRLRWTRVGSYFRNAVPALAWAVPVLTLLIFNKMTLGTWTGYDSTNESGFGTGFTLAKMSTTWEQMLRALYDTGLFFTFPLGIAGLFMLFRRHWVLGAMMLAWFVPGVALYTDYYFSPDAGIAYARFFLTFLPAALVGVAVCLRDGVMAGGAEMAGNGVRRVPRSLVMAAGVVTAIGAGVGVYRAAMGMESGRGDAQGLTQEFLARKNLAETGRVLASAIPAGSTVFAGGRGMGPMSDINYIQFVGDWKLFEINAFTGNRRPNFLGRMANGDATAPTPRQREQEQYESKLYAGMSARDLQAEQAKVINEALESGKRVFAVASATEIYNFRDTLRGTHGWSVKTVARWNDLTEPEEVVQQGRFGGRRNFGGGGGPGGGPMGGPGGGPPGMGGPMGGPGDGGPGFGGRGGFGGPGQGGFGGGQGRRGGFGRGNAGGQDVNGEGAEWELIEITKGK